MAPGTRKNKSKSTQSTTILSFFTPGLPGSSSNTNAKQKRRKSSVNLPPNQHEIIVIDSDSEDEEDLRAAPRKMPAKRPRTNQSSPDIEFVEFKSEVQVPSEPYVPFGKPTTLLLDTTPSVTSAAPLPEIELKSSPSSATVPPVPFSKPFVLLQSSRDNVSPEADAGAIIRDFSLEKDEDSFDLDEWGTGDDEISQITPEEEISEEVEQEILLDRCTTPQPNEEEFAFNRMSTPKPPRLLSYFGPPKPSPAPPARQDSKTTSSSNAYSVLMSSHKENQAWKEADVTEDRGFRPSKSNGGRRKAPFYKVLQGMPIAVDAFKYGTIPGVKAYFLTHAHSDHYTALSNTWNSGPIYCSEGTANLIVHMLRVDPRWVHPLPMDVPVEVPNTGGVHVCLIEANHCPGSCLFLFEGKQTVNAGDSTFKSAFVGSARTFRYLHCGDFRASPAHVNHRAVKDKRIDTVYLDTTYLDPKYTFPPQPLVISACADLAKRIQYGDAALDQAQPGTMNAWITSTKPNSDTKGKEKEKKGDVLMVVGTYSIGKERIVKAIAQALQSKIYCDSRKTAILRCQSDPELHALLTKNPFDAQVHVVPLGHVNLDKLKEYSEKYKGHFKKVVGFRPTGWTYTPPVGADLTPTIETIIARAQRNAFTYADLHQGRGSSSTLQVFPVPYSEHSSFFELTCFAMSFEWGKMIATVNVGSEASRGKMGRWVDKWEKERKKKGREYIVPSRKNDYW